LKNFIVIILLYFPLHMSDIRLKVCGVLTTHV